MNNPHPLPSKGSTLPILLYAGESRGAEGQGGAAAVLLLPNGRRFTVSQILSFASEAEADYQALIIGLRRARKLGLQRLMVKGDSELIFNQVNGLLEAPADKLRVLFREVMRLLRQFDQASLEWIPPEQNRPARRAVQRCIEEALGQEQQKGRGGKNMSPALAHLIQLGPQATDADFEALGKIVDSFSLKSLAELRSAVPLPVQDILALHWQGEEEELCQMYRWYLRGLPADLAIRKAQLDTLVSVQPPPHKLPWEDQLRGQLSTGIPWEWTAVAEEPPEEPLELYPPPPSQNSTLEPLESLELPLESLLLQESQNNFTLEEPVWLAPLSTATAEPSIMPETDRSRETLPNVDRVEQILGMVLHLSSADKARLVNELAQFPEITHFFLTAIAANLQK